MYNKKSWIKISNVFGDLLIIKAIKIPQRFPGAIVTDLTLFNAMDEIDSSKSGLKILAT